MQAVLISEHEDGQSTAATWQTMRYQSVLTMFCAMLSTACYAGAGLHMHTCT